MAIITTICSSCKLFIGKMEDANTKTNTISHGLCPECSKKLYPQYQIPITEVEKKHRCIECIPRHLMDAAGNRIPGDAHDPMDFHVDGECNVSKKKPNWRENNGKTE